MYKLSKNKMGAAMLTEGIGSAKDLAKLAGVSVNTLSRINNGGRATLATVQALAAALNIDPAELLEEV